ncbi:DUF2306 domain-containing protein [Glycomyces sp. A-F 0318]|uniref:DUF2306 domain-containing protein n=1 Tax=Glycomyces amatae TaxID=2881355 RepID=UPI001E3E0B24|nr:DUF2306 domain-containing protein [Glycomyces amatae]MCD0442055.1 DUF2306 domain-containing protein [Glycomyces amatae]
MPQSPALPRTEPAPPPARAKPRWYRRPWIAPLLVVAAVFIAMRLPAYLGVGGQETLLPFQQGFPELHRLLMVGHIAFGSIALVTCALQVWPWLRQRRPRAHRISGRLYVFAGVLPSGLLAGVVSVIAVQDPAGRIGNVALTVLWLGTTFLGLRAALRREYRDHRRWMIRSFALCWSIVANRVWIFLLVFVLMPFEQGYYGGDTEALIEDVAVASIWLSWIVNLLIAQWWLDRRPKRRDRSAPVAAA